jgi:hypothetical protein
MKKSIILIFLLFLVHLCFAQGFIKNYLLDNYLLNFIKIVNVNDTLYTYGPIIKFDSIKRQGLVFAKFDTLGNLLAKKEIFEPNNPILLAGLNTPFKYLSNGNFACTAQVLGNSDAFLIIDKNLNVKLFKYYSDKNSLVYYYRFSDIIETADQGFMLLANKDSPNYKPDSSQIVAVDKNGKVKWVKDIGDKTLCFGIGKIRKNNSNSFTFFKGECNSCFVDGLENQYCNVKYVEIDSSGNITNEKLIINWGEHGSDRETLLPNGNKMHLGSRLIWAKGNGFCQRPAIKVWDKNYDKVIWDRTYEDWCSSSYFEQGKIVNGGLIAVGPNFTTITHPTLGKQIVYALSTYKIDYTNGNVIWNRLDTVFPSIIVNSKYPKSQNAARFPNVELNAMDVLSSGSIVACGFVKKYDYDYAKDSVKGYWEEGLLYKIDRNGCMNPKDCAKNVVATKEAQAFEPENIKIFPNPTSDIVNIELSENEHIANVEIYDISGRRLERFVYETLENKIAIRLPDNDEVFFLVKVKTKSGSIAIQKVVKIK